MSASASGHLTFWFEFASPYSYLSAARMERLAQAAGVAVMWRPFLLGPVFAGNGWTDSPFNLFPAKGRYMVRDMERLCAAEGLGFRLPTGFPRGGVLAPRIAVAAAAESWLPEYVRAVYHANFVLDRDITKPQVMADILAGLGQCPTCWIEAAGTQDIKDGLRANTEDAQAKGIFGAPSFVVGDELFWGNDRLEHALDWARR